MKPTTAPKKLLELNRETLADISGGFPSTLGPLTATLRTATVATRTLPQDPKDTKLEA